MENTGKIVCRKCNGNHLTIKCGKQDSKKQDILKTEETPKFESNFKKENNFNKKEDTFNKSTNYEQNDYKRTINKFKIGSLPPDVTYEELYELLEDWGTIRNLKVLNYSESSTAYVEFRYADEVDYIIKALDRTPFDYLMITLEKLDS